MFIIGVGWISSWLVDGLDLLRLDLTLDDDADDDDDDFVAPPPLVESRNCLEWDEIVFLLFLMAKGCRF